MPAMVGLLVLHRAHLLVLYDGDEVNSQLHSKRKAYEICEPLVI